MCLNLLSPTTNPPRKPGQIDTRLRDHLRTMNDPAVAPTGLAAARGPHPSDAGSRPSKDRHKRVGNGDGPANRRH
ncbi:hypothetical protein N7462_008366 [Penicillium macrosclerotiorum]|uniref:uncharacterized protein n=1 Tax=Penicillium macrosclerotiorum TaxID=303699 RepID=UPI0025474B3B|nr:uncharacterized protein N7462_008366 [Penicillium macrosclerotiorum]KAJ5675469.1 hypothetical protein N7462_008366 [Penicillium macrosclerotiorum]